MADLKRRTVVIDRFICSHDNAVTLSRENLDGIDGVRLGGYTVRFDDRQRVVVDREVKYAWINMVLIRQNGRSQWAYLQLKD